MADGKVTFQWRDYRDGTEKLMTLDAEEFLRRFLLHVLPQGLCKIRYYGIMSNRNRKKMLAQCRALLGTPPSEEVSEQPKECTGLSRMSYRPDGDETDAEASVHTRAIGVTTNIVNVYNGGVAHEHGDSQEVRPDGEMTAQ
jgi:hypothetical protein